MKVLVCGSRNWDDPGVIKARMMRLPAKTEVIHGASRGADSLAGLFARSLHFYERPFPADWQAHGKKAGYLRNIAMLDEGPDLVLAFQVDHSKGTQHTIDEAHKRGIPVEVITS